MDFTVRTAMRVRPVPDKPIAGNQMQSSRCHLYVAALALVAGTMPIPSAVAASDGMTHSHGEAGHHHASAPVFSFGGPAPASQATRTIKITMGDVTFQPDTITVRAGEIVRFVVTNASGIDHEFTFGDAATEQRHREEMADMFAHGKTMAHDDANAITVRPGKTRELVWKFARAGQLEYACNIPGHYESGMKGVITVR